MPYVLEKISSKDKEKILNDANFDVKKKNALILTKHLENPSLNWAVDREHDCYMFSAPVLVRAETLHEFYYVFFKNTWYEIYVDSMFSSQVDFDSSSMLSGSLLVELQNQIKEAFFVYGRWGKGPSNEHGKPEYELVPQFKLQD